ncbi:MAG TPA: TlpA disulfide reductase family protein [Pseudomonas sp.]|nr:TlpA disulfide reductase family protein [Pseudomonas sp.]
MLSVSAGPLALGMSHVLLIVSFILALLVGWWSGRRSACNPEPQLFRLLLVSLLVARLSFVTFYFDLYRDSPWRMLDLRDGGFLALPGLLAGLVLGAWQAWRDARLRRPLGQALLVGVLFWGGGHLILQALERSSRLPEQALMNLEGQPVQLGDFRGRPLVINLWATWCPPCRREMPVLAEAQQRESGVTFLFVNQGEGARTVRDYLTSQGLWLENVLLDGGSRLGAQVGSGLLPTTLFYDAQGQQRGSHLGELSRASLAHGLQRIIPDSPERP